MQAPSSHFYDEVEAYLFISQLILYDKNRVRLLRDLNILEFWSMFPQLSQMANILQVYFDFPSLLVFYGKQKLKHLQKLKHQFISH
jgi:hypothetical protein